ncbi:MAG: hypothetical protein JWO79_4610 [Actinomycetia bacterium]|nr:hypothetical protein [Actinomycetes bacterium]
MNRADWAAAADRILLALRPYASPRHESIALPGPASRNGTASDGLEGFARSFLLAAIRLRGEGGADPRGFAEWYAAGLRAGTEPGAWPRLSELPQARVEACSIALALHWTRPWLWDRLAAPDQDRIAAWLGEASRCEYFANNWVWFQVITETFLRSVGGEWSAADVEGGLAMHESFYRGDGWYADGTARSFDHYSGWALHVYPLLWAELAGPWCPAELRERWRSRLARYLADAVLLVGADGSPLLQGRSLVYRFTAAAPFWTGALVGAASPGLVRRVCDGMLGHFQRHGVPDQRGLLTLGWHHEWPAMAQSYSGPASPYWAAKGMLGLALPAGHPVWTCEPEPLPVERGDTVAALAVPGWLVSGTKTDGIVRIVNHGTDHSLPGDRRSDGPLYARLGYSTATVPPAGPAAIASPADNAVTIVSSGRAAHRNGFEARGCEVRDGTGVAVSRARLHWVETGEDPGPEHGEGRSGTVTDGPVVTMGSLLRGAVEVRVARVDSPVAAGWELEFSGWPVASADPLAVAVAGAGAEVASGRLVSSVTGLRGLGDPGIRPADGSSPLGEHVAIPLVRASPPESGYVYAAAVVLRGSGSIPELPQVTVAGDVVSVRWPGGEQAVLTLGAAPTSPG